MIDRAIEPVLKELASKYPVVTLTGPRQSGKTTLCRKVFPGKAYVNLESPDTRHFALTDPRGFLARYPGGTILDEIQRAPALLSYIQTIVDEVREPGRYIVTGSQQFEVSNTVNQSLAGRTALLKLLPLSVSELRGKYGPLPVDRLLLAGFYPRIYDQDLDPTQALGDYLATYVERDIRQLLAIKDLGLFEKFVRLTAGRVGQILNLNSLAGDVGISHPTARGWMTLLEASFVVFLLPPWFGNVSKRLIKSPKLYFHDVGLASYLLGLENERQVSRDPLRGNLFENLAVVEALKYRWNRGKRANLNFYRDSRGNEVDLLISFGSDLFPVEIKAGATIASDAFRGLDKVSEVLPRIPFGKGLIYGGEDIQIRSGVRVHPVTEIESLLRSVDPDAPLGRSTAPRATSKPLRKRRSGKS
ncbi:MAG: ATP-binding protein [Deltaproteobacteria bacterium]|nr:ATP-binding protein [Deltaproteobacteria bacterium]